MKNRSNINTISTKNSSIMLQDTADENIRKAWLLFANAVLAHDTILVKKLSTDCIHCSSCLTNSQAEDSIFKEFTIHNPDTWYDKMYSDLCYLPIDKFMREDAPIIFKDKIKSRLLNPAKIKFTGAEQNKDSYNKNCIYDTSRLGITNYREVLVTTIDPSPEYEGAQNAYAFIQTKDGFKFCGFSTIP